ncbi:MAG: ATP-binding protein [Actinomycetota bacterium]|nr:ATP-binding protein [Actinomycetota bacterium]
MTGKEVPRAVAPKVLEALSDTPVVVVNGPRQAGKTTLVRSLPYPGSVEVVSLDDPTARAAAGDDPRAFVERPVDTLVVDEAQLEPRLFRAIKASVDANRRPGRFLLTGSSRLLAAPDMADALVGRVETIELWPFAERELAYSTEPSFIDAIFDSPRTLVRRGSATRAEISDRLLRGGFPEAVRRRPPRRRAWFDNYVRTITQQVIRELADLERLADIPRLLALCAARTGTELNTASIAGELGIPARTLSTHLAHLSTAFLVRLVPAWSTNLSAKVVRRPKLVMADVGLAAHLQGVTAAGLDRPQTQFGPLLETLVATEIQRQLSWSHSFATLSHFRDRSGVEVDLVLEHPDGRIVGIEVKATGTPRTEDLRGLRFLADRLGDRFHFGCLLSTALEATPFGPKLATLPLSSLWDPVR